MRASVATLIAVFLGLTVARAVAQQGSSANVGPANRANSEKSLCGNDTAPPGAVHADGKITQGNLIYKVRPSYPKAAREAHIEGTVVLCAYISKEGEIKNLRAVAGPPELIPPSIEAVNHWRYKPYLLNGEAVEVNTEVEVRYSLKH